jgi:hypothetical protein
MERIEAVMMASSVQADFANLWSTDRGLQNAAFDQVLALTDERVEWAYDVWDDVVLNLTHTDNHNRAIASQILCNLAKSDPDGRILASIDQLFAVTHDRRFVTARHCLQALWKIGVAGEFQREVLLDEFATRFGECAVEKNCTLIRYDIIVGMRKLYDKLGKPEVRERALALIEEEDSFNYRKKYAQVWKKT